MLHKVGAASAPSYQSLLLYDVQPAQVRASSSNL